jgi:Flp pilus assembly pilin Flp
MKRLLRDTRGANLVEYIVLVGMIALLSIGAFKVYQNKVRGKVVEQAKTTGAINHGSGNLDRRRGRGVEAGASRAPWRGAPGSRRCPRGGACYTAAP